MKGEGGTWALAAVLAAAPALALDPGKSLVQYTHEAWLTAHGLPQNSVTSLVQTRDGYVWLGTQEGLVRFDGVRFTVFDRSNTPAIASNHVVALLEARDGVLWVGTYGGGLVRMQGGRFEALSTREGLPGDVVTALAEDRGGRIWVGTSVAGAACLEGGRARLFGQKDGLPSDAVRALAAAPDGSVWIGTAAGLARIGSGSIRTFTNADGLPSPAVTALHVDSAGTLWVGTQRGLLRRAGDRFEAVLQPLSNPMVRCILADRAGSVWVGTQNGLNRIFAGRSDAFKREQGLTEDAVGALVEDREGSLWIGTEGGGLNRLKEGKVTTFTTRDGLARDDLYCVAPARDGGLWIANYSGDVDHWKDAVVTHLDSRRALGVMRVYALHEDRAGVLWLGTQAGLWRYQAGRFTLMRGVTSTTVRAIRSDSRGVLWVGTDGAGVVRLEGDTARVLTTRDGLGGDEVRDILEDSHGDVWIGTYGGLSRYQQGRFHNYTTADGLAYTLVRTLFEGRDGALWIGTYGGGLSRLQGGRFASVTSRQGLFSDVVYAILEDDAGQLWMTCNRGIFRIAKADFEAVAAGKSLTLRSSAFGEADGMRSRECNGGNPAAVATADGKLWVPTLRGLVMVDPAHLPVNSIAPTVVIEEALLDGERVEVVAGLRVPPGRHRLELGFTGLSLLAPDRVRFSYRLEGFDAGWVEAGSRRLAAYTNVPPGRYLFRVMAANADGVWNRDGASLALVVEPRMWETRWFAALSAVALVALTFGLVRLRTARYARREQELQRRVEEEMARVKVLSGLLPICANCKKVRDDRGYWEHVEVYIRERSEADFSHSICPDCMRRLYPELH